MIERPDRTQVLKDFEGRILVLAGKHDSAVNAHQTLPIFRIKPISNPISWIAGITGIGKNRLLCSDYQYRASTSFAKKSDTLMHWFLDQPKKPKIGIALSGGGMRGVHYCRTPGIRGIWIKTGCHLNQCRCHCWCILCRW
jgi:hypothetical protein